MGTEDKKGFLLEEMTWPEAEAAFRDVGIMVIPVGAVCKEHGPHLPLNTDFLLADHLRRHIARAYRVVVAPVVGWGYYPTFAAYPGSVSLHPETFMCLISDICTSFVRQGIRLVIILNTGISTTPPLSIAVRELSRQLGVPFALINLEELGREVIENLLTQPAGTHADELETSLLLAIDAGKVAWDRAVADFPQTRGLRKTRLHMPQAVGGPYGFTATGIFGDATAASEEKGKRAWAAILEDLKEIDEIARILEKPEGGKGR